MCRLHHGDLLDAAHITADSDEAGLAIVTNGLSLCKIHHAAYDRQLLGITSDYRVEINRALLDEIDGPMLKHGLQEMHARPSSYLRVRLSTPTASDWPRGTSCSPRARSSRWTADSQLVPPRMRRA